MATPRFRRVNIDGKSLFKTETRLASAAILPGTFVVIDDADDQFEQIAAATGGERLYVADVGYAQGLNIMEANPAGNSMVGNYVEARREFAVRFAGGTSLVKDQPITVGAGGLGVAAAADADPATIVAFSQETVTLPAGAQDFIRVRTA